MLHKYQETSWTYPASEKITFDNYKDQPYAFNKTIETQNVLTPFNPLEPNSVSYANKDGLPYDRIIKADPLKSVYQTVCLLRQESYLQRLRYNTFLLQKPLNIPSFP